MTNPTEKQPPPCPPGVRLADGDRWVLRILTMTLSTCGVGAILYLVLVVAPSAGAAGGCGGG